MRIISYNLEYAKSATPAEIADMLRSYSPDVICFCEVPSGDWTALVGECLEMKYYYVGDVASANHDAGYPDKTGRFSGKFKSILSKTPLRSAHELGLSGVGWSPASVVLADTTVDGVDISLGALHIPSGSSDPEVSCAANLAEFMEEFRRENIILCGDFNDVVDSAPMRALYDRGFENAWTNIGFNWSENMTCGIRGGYNCGVIDHIIFRGGLEAIEAGIIPEEGAPLADHSAIFAALIHRVSGGGSGL